MPETQLKANRLIALLPEEDRQRLERDSIAVSISPFARVVCSRRAGRCRVISAHLCLFHAGGAGGDPKIDIASIGNEGATGVLSLLNAESRIDDIVAEIPDDALRLDMQRFQRYAEDNSRFNRLMHRYLFALTRQIVQCAVCDRLHSPEQRCVRWLLMTRDRAGGDSFFVKQDLLTAMLALCRTTVNLAMRARKAAGVTNYACGQITIIDRQGLESPACPCYRIICDGYAAITLS